MFFNILAELATKNGKLGWTGGVIQMTHFPNRTTPCTAFQFPIGVIHPKNPFFASEKTWRLWENGDSFASQSADPLRESYDGILWEELRNFKFAGAVRMTQQDGSIIILSFSGLPPWLDEAVVYCLAEQFGDRDGLLIPPYSNNPLLEQTRQAFRTKSAFFV